MFTVQSCNFAKDIFSLARINKLRLHIVHVPLDFPTQWRPIHLLGNFKRVILVVLTSLQPGKNNRHIFAQSAAGHLGGNCIQNYHLEMYIP